jgi:hypothetical protein
MKRPIGFYTDKKKRVRPITNPSFRPNVPYISALPSGLPPDAYRSDISPGRRARLIVEAYGFKKPRGMTEQQWKRIIRNYRPELTKMSIFQINPGLKEKLQSTFSTTPDEIYIHYPKTEKEWEFWMEAKGMPITAAYEAEKNIYINPKYVDVLSSNSIKTHEEITAINTIIHEIMHAMNKEYSDLPSWLEEGTTQYSTLRFIGENYDISPEVRDYIVPITEYSNYLDLLGELGLKVSQGDVQKAHEWVNSFRTYQGDRKEYFEKSLRRAGIEEEDIQRLLRYDKLPSQTVFALTDKYKNNRLAKDDRFRKQYSIVLEGLQPENKGA